MADESNAYRHKENVLMIGTPCLTRTGSLLIVCTSTYICTQVVVNQDKTSQQLAMMRTRIQGLELELQEFKSGRMVVSEDGSATQRMTSKLWPSSCMYVSVARLHPHVHCVNTKYACALYN